ALRSPTAAALSTPPPGAPLCPYTTLFRSTEGGRHGVATSLYRELHDPLRIEVDGIRRKAGPRRVLDPLVHREDGHVTGATESAMIQQGLIGAEHLWRAVRAGQHAIHEVRAGQVKRFAREAPGLVSKQLISGVAEQLGNRTGGRRR